LKTLECIEFEVSDNELINGLKRDGYCGRILLKLFILDSTYKFHYKYFWFDIDKKAESRENTIPLVRV
jgi:hypothetical protein